MKKLIGIILFLIIAISACASTSFEKSVHEKVGYSVSNSGSSYDMAVQEEMAEADYASDRAVKVQYSDNGGAASPTEIKVTNVESVERKMIENISLDLETLEFDKTASEIINLINKYNGYIQNSSVNGTGLREQYKYNTRTGRYTLRIPVEHYSMFVEEIKALGNVVYENAYRDDVTNQYVDIDSRLRTLKVQEERLLSILEKVEELKEIVELEKALADVRYEIETYTTNMRTLDNLVSYATVSINLREVVEETIVQQPPKTIGDKIVKAFTNSINNLKEISINLIIAIVALIPFLIILAFILFFIIYIIRRIRRANIRKTNHFDMQDHNDQKGDHLDS